MDCPNCTSQTLRRSRRQGFKENILYRAVLLAPVRCPQCGFRRYARSGKGRNKRGDRKHPILALLGVRKEKRGKFQRNALAIGIGTVVLLMALYLLSYFIETQW